MTSHIAYRALRALGLSGNALTVFVLSVQADTNTTNTLLSGVDLLAPASWSRGAIPNVTDDAVLTASGPTSFTLSGTNVLTVGSLDYLGTAAATLANNTASSTSTLTFGGPGNFGNGLPATYAEDLLYVKAGGSFTLQNGSGALNVVLGQNGNIDAGSAVAGSAAGSITFNVPIGGPFGFTKVGSGTLTLAGASTYTGTTAIRQGALLLDFSVSGSPASNIINSGNDASGGALALGGGTLQVRGKSSAANSQTFSGTTIATGGSKVTLTQNGASSLTLALGPISRNSGGVVNFTSAPSTSGIVATTTSNNDATGILGPWMTLGTGTGLSYATVNANQQIVAYAGTTADAGNFISVTNSLGNYGYSTAATLAADASANTLRYTGAASTTTLGNYNLTLNGVMNAGSGALTIAAGTGGTGKMIVGYSRELIVANSGQAVSISAPIADSVSGPSKVVYAGTSNLTLSGANTFSGGLVVANLAAATGTSRGGIVALSSSSAAGTGPITLAGVGPVNGANNMNLFAGVAALALPQDFIIPAGTQNRYEFSVGGTPTFALNGSITGSGLFALSSGFNPTMQLGGDVTGFTGILQLQGNGASNSATTNYDFTNTVTIGAPVARIQLAPGVNGTNAGNIVNLRWNPASAVSATIPLGELSTILASTHTSANAILVNAKAGTTATWQIGALGTHSTFGGNIIANASAPTAVSAVEKVGSGTLTLSGTHTYTGGTTVAQGTLRLNGSHTQTATVNGGRYIVAAGATVGGAGTITLSDSTGSQSGISVSGMLAPGGDTLANKGLGTLAIDGAASLRPVISFAPGATLAFDLDLITGSNASDCVTILNPQANDVIFNDTIINVTDRSTATLNVGEQVTLFRVDASSVFAGLTVDADNVITGGLRLGQLPAEYSRSKLLLVGDNIVLQVMPALKPALVSATAVSGRVGAAFHYQIVATNDPVSFAAVALPDGLTLDPANGLISGVPTTAGVSTTTISATNSDGTGSTNITITIDPAGAPVIGSAGSASATVGSPFSYQIVASGSPSIYDASGLPSGLSVDPTTGLISGTPTTYGTFYVILGATDAATGTGTATLALEVAAIPPVITSSLQASATIGQAFTYTITADYDARRFDAEGLPAGLAVDKATGVIFGTPTALGTSSVTISASNLAGTDTKTLTLTVLPQPPVVTSLNYISRVVGGSFNYRITGSNSPTSFSAAGLPPGLSLDAATGVISGTPTTAGNYTATVSASNTGGTGSMPLTLSIGPRYLTHPGIPFTVADLDALKARLNTEPWKSAYAALAADGHSKITYNFTAVPASVSRTPDVNLPKFKDDTQAIYNLARMWYFTGDTAYAQKARDMALAWAANHKSFDGAEMYLSMGDYTYRFFGGIDILRGTWPGWTQSDTDVLKAYVKNVWLGTVGWTPIPYPIRSANQGMLQLTAATGAAVFLDDEQKLAECIQSYRADAVASLPDSLPNGQIGDMGRDQGHAYGQMLALAWLAEVFWKQGVDVFSEMDNRVLAVGEMYARYNLGVNTPYIPFGTKYDYFWSGFGGAPGSVGVPPDVMSIVHGAYVIRKGLNAPFAEQFRAVRPENMDSFMFRKVADSSTAAPMPPLTPAAPTASVTTGLIDADIGGATPAGSSSYSNGTWTVTGGGLDIWGSSDSYHFAYRQVTGDFTMIARITSLEATHVNAKAAIVMCDSVTATAARRIYFGYAPGNKLIESHQRGYTYNSHNDPDELTHDGPTPMLPHWLKIQRIGSRISVYHSADGGSWTPLQNAEYAGWTDTAYVGLGVCSHVNGTPATATFTDVRITGGDGAEPDKVPLAPLRLYASPDGSFVTLRWPEAYGATSYKVKRAIASGGPYMTIASVSGTTYVDSAGGSNYYYVVSSANEVGESGNSPEETGPMTGVPIAPEKLTASAGGGAVNLTWSASSGATSYNVKRSTSGDGPYVAVATVTTTSFSDTTGPTSTYYHYVISPVNASGEGLNSMESGGLLQGQPIITSPMIANATYGSMFTYTVTSTEQPATFEATPLPPGLSFDPASGVIAGTPIAAGSYTVLLTVTNTAGATSRELTIDVAKAAAGTIVLAPLVQYYDGTPRAVTGTTNPLGLSVDFTYNGSPLPPVYPGEYTVGGAINDANYSGSASGTLKVGTTVLVRHAPTFDGMIDGSVQVLSAESMSLNGESVISGDLLVPGTPIVQLNGQPILAGTKDGPGSSTPANYAITINGDAVLRYLIRRVDEVALPSVAAPLAPVGSRSVTLSKPGQSAGDFTTLRNLTLNGSAGVVTVPAGAYGDFIANGSAGFILGTAGSAEPTQYHFQRLVLNGTSTLQVVGPVVVTLANGTTINATAGSVDHPEWLTLKLRAGGVTLNTGAMLHGHVIAPAGAVTINADATLHGSVAADRVTVSSGGLLDEAAR